MENKPIYLKFKLNLGAIMTPGFHFNATLTLACKNLCPIWHLETVAILKRFVREETSAQISPSTTIIIPAYDAGSIIQPRSAR
jgi:hypothetical protein